MRRTATAVWRGGPQAGEGTVTTSSGVLNKVIYTFGNSAIDLPCTNPCEMLAAAEAACVSLMVAKELATEGVLSDEVETCAELIVIDDKDGGWSIPKIHLTVNAHLPEVDNERFQRAVQRAKQNCPITRTLKAQITMETILKPATVLAASH